MTRTETHQHFIARFCSGNRSQPVTDSELDRAEERLSIQFPKAYREFLTVHGAAHSHSLLSLIVDSGSDLWDLTAFMVPAECVETTESYRSAGMSERLVAFASDSMGNVFCFDERDLLDARPDDAPVWLFDHDFCSDEQLTDSFDSWLASYFVLP